MQLTGLTHQIMKQVTENPGINIATLAKTLNLHPGSIDRPIRTLREIGLVRTKPGRGGGIFPTEDAHILIERGEIHLARKIDVQITARDRVGLLADISSRIARRGGNIILTHLDKPDPYTVEIQLRIEDVTDETIKRELSEITDIKGLEVETV